MRLVLAAAFAMAAAAAYGEIEIVVYSAPAGDHGAPVHRMLSCEAACTNIIPPALFTKYRPLLKFAEGAEFKRAFPDHIGDAVDLSIEIGTDEKVQNVIVERAIGSREFVDDVLASLNDSTFAPARTAAGRVVSAVRYRIALEGHSEATALPPETAAKLAPLASLVAAKKFAEAVGVLDAVLTGSDLNFWQHATLSLNKSRLCLQVGDEVCALEAIRDATFSDGFYLDDATRADAVRERIVLEGRAGQYAEAFAWFDVLKKCCDMKPDDPAVKIVDALHAALAKPDPLAALGAIPSDTAMSTWHHTLFRRTFAFQHVTGTLDRFEVRCTARKLASKVLPDSQWTVPKAWSDCEMYVFGAPGTTFQVVEVP